CDRPRSTGRMVSASTVGVKYAQRPRPGWAAMPTGAPSPHSRLSALGTGSHRGAAIQILASGRALYTGDHADLVQSGPPRLKSKPVDQRLDSFFVLAAIAERDRLCDRIGGIVGPNAIERDGRNLGTADDHARQRAIADTTGGALDRRLHLIAFIDE